MKPSLVRSKHESLCESCEDGFVARGDAPGRQYIHCHAMGRQVCFQVTSCTAYSPRHGRSLKNFESTAWIIRMDAKAGRIGFFAPGTPEHSRAIHGSSVIDRLRE